MPTPETADLDQLFHDHYRAVLRYVVRRAGDRDRAHDIAAEVFLVAWQRRRELPAQRALPWLYGVAANVLAHARRSDLRAASAYGRFGNNLVTRSDPGPGEQLEWSDDLAQTLTALRELSPADQEVLMLVAWEELRGKDLAAALGCSSAAAAVRLHRARRRLAAVRARHGRQESERSAGSAVVAGQSNLQGEH
ncbi:RNA polymerase sigma factor [Kribbella sp. NBC_00359]|uniref:RNA polymerase sigma factor n=1 Tax=Kribbella sp. NBC_00359 TaxID=2975966 RepID=UPI002E207B47